MATLVTALSLALWLISLAVYFQVTRKNQRSLRLKDLELRPNCLLTRYPIAFIEGPKSVFRLFEHWNGIPQYLREHGYEVLVIESLTRGDRAANLLSAVQELPGKCHVIGDSSCEDDLNELARQRHEKIATLTLIKNRETKAKNASRAALSAEDLRPRQMAIEIFEVRDSQKSTLQKRTLRWTDVTARSLLLAHNFLCLMKRRKPVDPIETGESIATKSWDAEAPFLDLAISLAERDLQWCD